jgi:hypothetical protein
VESQQTEPATAEKKSSPTAEDLDVQRKRESLELSRTRITRELETARTEAHRAALGHALKYLDEELAKLG